MSKPIIEVQNLSKLYRLGTVGATTLRESTQKWWHKVRGEYHKLHPTGHKRLMIEPNDSQAGPEPNTMWALKDISFSINQGEIVGIIGRNGAGKSTLLKILSKITEPTSGKAILRGRVSSLLEVGTGFHPELTGRENIYLNGAILGMRKNEIDKKFDEIVAFAEIDKFIDTPVKHYSSGMHVRLAFAVAAHLEPEILLVDEVLAVGDIAFQKKCVGEIQNVANKGRTVLFVSHNMQAILALTQNTIMLEAGKASAIGSTSVVVQKYCDALRSIYEGGYRDLTAAERGGGDQKVRLIKVTLKNSEDEITNCFNYGEPIIVILELSSDVYSNEGSVGFGIRTPDGAFLFVSSSSDAGQFLQICPGTFTIEAKIDPNFLKPQRYYLSAGITCGVMRDYVPEVIAIDIHPTELLNKTPLFDLPGYLYIPFSWTGLHKLD